jgi:hypothetical protein
MWWDGNTSAPRSCLFLPGLASRLSNVGGGGELLGDGRIASIPRPPPRTCPPDQLLHQPGSRLRLSTEKNA